MSRMELEFFLKKYIPSGWVGPIMDFDFAPHVSDQDFKIVTEGKIPEGKKYEKWYVKAAVQEWQKRNITTSNVANNGGQK